MAVSPATSLRRPRTLAVAGAPAGVAAALVLLAALSLPVRTERFDVGYWIDEGLSVGIADRTFTEIPGVLRQDGSPPLYYLLLHVWIRLIGDTSEPATHALSLLLATATIPVVWALTRALFGMRAAWMAAVLAAFNPFLTQYAQETRMYALVVLLGTVCVGCFLGAFVQRRGRRWTLAFALAFGALLYTHNWALFLGCGLAAAWGALLAVGLPDERERLVRDGLIVAALIAALYAPWIPTLLFQAAHTGAPWANPPDFEALVEAPERLLGYTGQYVLLVGVVSGLAGLLRGRVRRWPPEGRAAVALLTVAVVTVILPWAVSQVSPSWATRYLAAAVPPLLLASAVVLSRTGRLGVGVVTLVALLWIGDSAPAPKSNVREVVATIAPSLRPGDLIVSTQPEVVPVAHHYLADAGLTGLRWATLWGPVADLGVTDWRDGTQRLRASRPERDLAPLLDAVGPGRRVVLLQPDFLYRARWRAPWTALVRQRSTAWEQWMRNDRRFRVVDSEPTSALPPRSNPVRALVLVREPVG